MPGPISTRRVVIENNAQGKSATTGDEVLTAAAVKQGGLIRGNELWVTDAMPVDNSAATRAQQVEGCLARFHNLFVGNGQGSAFRITEFPPGHPKLAHRTETVDYDLVLAGEIDVELEDGETVHLKTGDTLVVRGAMHAWINRGSASAVVAFVMLDAKPVVVGGEPLRTHYPSGADPSA